MDLSEVDKGRVAWWLLGLVLLSGLVFVAHSFVGTLVFGIFIYYATRPIFRQIRRATDSPSLAAAVSLFTLVLPALLLVAYALAIVLQEVDRYAKSTDVELARYGIDPAFVDRVADPATLLEGGMTDLLSAADVGQLLGSIGSAFGTLATLGVALVHLFVMLALAFYLLRDDHRLSRWFHHRFGDEGGVLREYFRAVDRDFNSIFFGNILNAVLTGTIGVIAYSALNVFAPPGLRIPAPALVGLLAGVASLIPVVGMKLVYVPVAGLMLVQALVMDAPGTLAFVVTFAVVSFVVVDTIPDLVLRPYVSGRSLHVGAVMLAYTLGPLLFGWYGIFLMPMLLVTTVHFARIVLPELLSGTRIEPFAIDPGHMAVDTGDFEFGGRTARAGESLSGGDETDAAGEAGTDGGGTGTGRVASLTDGDDADEAR